MWEYFLDGRIVMFDGRVVEHFPGRGASMRFHIANLALAEVEADKKGRQYLRLSFDPGGGFITGELTPEMAAEAEKLVEELKAVKARR